MNRKQKIIVSITGIFIVLLALFGLTYAYFLTQINGNNNPTSVTVSTANLVLEYGDGNGVLSPAGYLVPDKPVKFLDEDGNEVSSKTFTVENKGNADISNYAVTLENFSLTYTQNGKTIDGVDVIAGQETTFAFPETMRITIECKSSDNQPCNGITDNTFPQNNTILFYNSISEKEKHEYTLTMEYQDNGEDQSADMNKTLSAKINIVDPNNTVDLIGRVDKSLVNDGDYVQINSEPKTSRLLYDEENDIYTYKIVGVKPDDHTIGVYNNVNTEIIKGANSLSIIKGTEASVEGNVVTITDDSRVVNLDILDSNKINIDESITNFNPEIPYDPDIFAYKLIDSAKKAFLHNDATRTSFNESYNLNAITMDTVIESVLGSTEDDYGTSYVFRGLVKDNYVKFAGFTWRVLRINGDGTVRLILDDNLHMIKREGLNVYAGSKTAFNTSRNDNAYIGYMYGLNGMTASDNINKCLVLENDNIINKIDEESFSTKDYCESNGGKWTTSAYESAQVNLKDSSIKMSVDQFYEEYIENENYHYAKYLADSIFCGDKTVAAKKIGYSNSTYGYGKGDTYRTSYAAMGRLLYSTGTTKITTATPTLKCATDATNDYSRYTVDVHQLGQVNTNGDLKYPIGLVSADELMMTGIWKKDIVDKKNLSYLFDGYKKNSDNRNDRYWTMSPVAYNNAVYASIFHSSITQTSMFSSYLMDGGVGNEYGVRPVINLNALVKISGTGTQKDPYIIDESAI